MKYHLNMTLGTAVVATALFLVFVSTAQGKPTPSFTPIYGGTATYTHALQVRSEALNAKYGLGDFASPRNVGYLRARHLRPAAFTQSLQVIPRQTTTPMATQSSGGFDLRDGLISAAALFATILVVGAAVILTQRRQSRPLSV